MKKLLSIGMAMIMIIIMSGCSSSGALDEDGRKSFAHGNYEEAAASFAAAIEKNPNRADYYIDYGLALIRLGKYDDALKEFDQAYVNKDIIIVNQNNKKVYRGKGIAYYYKSDYQKAVDEFDKALQMNALPDLDMDILYYVGSAQMMLGSYADAEKTYTKLIAIDDKNAYAYNCRAACYRNIEEYEKSKSDYDMAISLKPDCYTYYLGKYDLLIDSNDKAGASEVLTKASEIEVKSNEDKYHLAIIHYYQEDYDAALTELNNGFANGFKQAYFYIGEIYRIQKDYQKAIYYYDIFINEGERPESSVYNQAAVCLIKLKEYEKALEYLEKGITMNYSGTMQILKRNEIIAYERLGDFTQADSKLKEYIGLYPEDKKAGQEEEFVKTRVVDAVIPASTEE